MERCHWRRADAGHFLQALPALSRVTPAQGAPDRPISTQLPVAPGGFWCGEARHDGHSDACAPARGW